MQMKEFKVRIVITECYEVTVEATDWETAEELAREEFDSGELDMTSYSETYEAEEIDA